ncbi:MAG: peptidase S8, partial [Actinobacteria bacterium]|nr:peptidase S8 [Actinomycetota bacterium]
MTDFFKGHRTSFLAGLAALVLAAASAVAFLAGSSGEGAPPARVQVSVDRPAGLPTVLVPTQPHTAAPVRPDLLSRAGTSAGDQAEPEYVPGQLLVKFQEDATPAAAAAALERVDGEVDESVRRLEVSVVDVPDGQAARALAQLEASPAVAYAERDVALAKFDTIPNDSLWRDQWGPALVHAPRAWDSGTGSGSTVVAVLDTGVDRTHPDLQGALVGGYDVVHGDGDPLDEDGHGTSSAGVIGARTNNTTGQAGVCWGCSLMPVQVLDENGSGTTSDVATGIVWAADHGARVISMSLGGEGTTQTLTAAVAYAASKGVVLVAAAGNSGSSTPTYPAAYPQVIGVAGSTPEDTLYSWSNYGSWVRVAAPGCNVATARGGGYVNFCGTSSAAPVVAGLVGLALSYKPVAGAAAIEAAITGSGAHFDGVQSGRIDAAGTLVALGAPSAGSGSSRPA